MLSALSYMREDLLVQYEGLTEELLRAGTITNNDTSTIIKAVLLLSNIYHKPSARLMVYKLLQLLNFAKFQLFIPHLHNLYKVRGKLNFRIVIVASFDRNSKKLLTYKTCDTNNFVYLTLNST